MKISARLAFFAIVVTLAYLGLAVWGMGGFAAFFSHAPLVVVVLATLMMAIASLFTEVNLSAGEREDRANRWGVKTQLAVGIHNCGHPVIADQRRM